MIGRVEVAGGVIGRARGAGGVFGRVRVAGVSLELSRGVQIVARFNDMDRSYTSHAITCREP